MGNLFPCSIPPTPKPPSILTTSSLQPLKKRGSPEVAFFVEAPKGNLGGRGGPPRANETEGKPPARPAGVSYKVNTARWGPDFRDYPKEAPPSRPAREFTSAPHHSAPHHHSTQHPTTQHLSTLTLSTSALSTPPLSTSAPQHLRGAECDRKQGRTYPTTGRKNNPLRAPHLNV